MALRCRCGFAARVGGSLFIVAAWPTALTGRGLNSNVIGEVVSEQVEIVPMQVRVLRHVRKTCACPTCQMAPITAAMPPQPIPKSNASANTIAFVATGKFVDGDAPVLITRTHGIVAHARDLMRLSPA